MTQTEPTGTARRVGHYLAQNGAGRPLTARQLRRVRRKAHRAIMKARTR